MGPSNLPESGPAYLDNITFMIIPDDLARKAKFEAKEVNFIVDVPRQREVLRKWENENIKVIVRPRPSLVYVGFNCSTPGLPLPPTAENSPVNDVMVRRAIEHAIYKENIIQEVYENLGSIAHGPLATSIWGYSSEIENMYSYDPERARSLLVQARYANGIELEVLTLSPYLKLAEALRDQLNAIGVNLKIKVVEELEHQIAKCQHDMFIWEYAWHDASMISFLFHTSRVPHRNRFWGEVHIRMR